MKPSSRKRQGEDLSSVNVGSRDIENAANIGCGPGLYSANNLSK